MANETNRIKDGKFNKFSQSPVSLSIAAQKTSAMSLPEFSRLAIVKDLHITKRKLIADSSLFNVQNRSSSFSTASSNRATPYYSLTALLDKINKNKQTPLSSRSNDTLCSPLSRPIIGGKKRNFHSASSSSTTPPVASDTKNTKPAKKRVRFRPDHELVSYHSYPAFGEWDHAKPPTSTSAFLSEQRQNFLNRLRQCRRNQQIKWYPPRQILVPNSYKVPWPKNSPEATIQQEREKVTLRAIYTSLLFVPPSPAEPDEPAVANDSSPIIPLEYVDTTDQTPSVSTSSSTTSSSPLTLAAPLATSLPFAGPGLLPSYIAPHLFSFSPFIQQLPSPFQDSFLYLLSPTMQATGPLYQPINPTQRYPPSSQQLQPPPPSLSVPEYPSSSTQKKLNKMRQLTLQDLKQQMSDTYEKRTSSSSGRAMVAAKKGSSNFHSVQGPSLGSSGQQRRTSGGGGVVGSSKRKVCIFYSTPGGCVIGARCPFPHID